MSIHEDDNDQDIQGGLLQNDIRIKRKSVALGAFTRVANSAAKLLDSDYPSEALGTVLIDLQEKYNILEEKCQEIMLLEGHEEDFNDLLQIKYEVLTDIRAKVMEKSAKQVADDIDVTQASSQSTSADDTRELIKGFKASLTLPKQKFDMFDGNSSKFADFMSYVETYVEDNVDNPKQRLTLLINTCEGMARASIAFLLQKPDAEQAYKEAKCTLKDLFGKEHQIVRAVLEDCTEGPEISADDIDELKMIVINMKKAKVTLEECDMEEELKSSHRMVRIYRRLPKPVQGKWNTRLVELQENKIKPNFDHMCGVITKYIQSRDNIYTQMVEQQEVSSRSRYRSEEKTVFAIETERVLKCIMCNGGHYLNQCKEFLLLNIKDRFEYVSRKQLCRNCFHSGHIAGKCKRDSLCKRCKSKHNDVLHDSEFKQKFKRRSTKDDPKGGGSDESSKYENHSRSNNYTVTKGAYAPNNSAAGITCIDVLVEGRNGLYKCKAIVDNKSSVNMCSKRLTDKLKLPSTPFKTILNVATGSSEIEGQRIHNVKVYSEDKANYVDASNVLTVDRIPLSTSAVFTQEDIDECDHLRGIKLPRCFTNDEIDLLIGSSTPKAFHQSQQRKGNDDQIYAVKMTLGWDLVGPRKRGGQDKNVFFIGNAHLNNEITNNYEKVFDQDFKDCTLFSSKVGVSREDKQAISLIEKSITHKQGQFEVGIPWKQDPRNLPSNKEVVMKRLNGLKKRFQREPELRQAYAKEMSKMIDNGFLEKCTKNKGQIEHYVPHHPVWHPKKNTLRVVWDCAMSLNDFIYEGPDLLNSLTEVLIRFRRFKFAVTSDIRKMYLNVKLPPKDRETMKVLWWSKGDISKEPDEYRATVHIYGAKSSSFVANYCVRRLGDNVENMQVTDLINKDMYVDDQASSIENENEAVSLIQNVNETLAKGKFHLTKFVSNSKLVMDSIAREDHGIIENEGHSILGLTWKVNEDTLRLPRSSCDQKLQTRRALLSAVAQMYDPLGFVAPTALPVKVMLQEKASLDWDRKDSDIEICWNKYRQTLEQIQGFSVPRCYKPKGEGFEKPKHVSLHGFGDASNIGYSAVVYLRQVATNGRVAISFIIGKSRVAPKIKGLLNAATIPKLELNAAALNAKLVEKVKLCINIAIDEVFYWCDSQAVLSSLCADDKRFPVFWTNRLSLIHGLSRVSQWRYVPSKCNPADLGSRGVSSEGFDKKMYMWLNGPSFLTLGSSQWPEHFCPQGEANVFMMNKVEVKVTRQPDALGNLVRYYSDLSRLTRFVVRLRRFMNKAKATRNAVEEIVKAHEALIRYEQKTINEQHLVKLKPFKDVNGILRVGGRLSNMEHLTYEEKHPAILPKGSNLTKLIINEEHIRSAHLGANHVLCQLRSKYWIIGGQSTVRHAVSECRKCKEKLAKPLNQIMSDLPIERGTPSFPFQNVGIDFFGPFYCTVQRRRFKRYGCIFVCLTTRAIHLECVNSMETSAFLCALSRFISRRGNPDKIFSDNGSNFKGAQKELLTVQRQTEDDVMKFAIRKKIKWHFHPPKGSHHGGHYERFIRTVRTVLSSLTNEQRMTEDDLTTVLCEVEKVVNDRPLTRVSQDINDSTPLTPSLILLLRGNSCKSTYAGESSPSKQHRQAQYLADLFWSRWVKEYARSLQVRQKWLHPVRNLQVGDLILMCDEGHPRGQWPMGRVHEIHQGIDGFVRQVTIQTKAGLRLRPITKLALLEGIV